MHTEMRVAGSADFERSPGSLTVPIVSTLVSSLGGFLFGYDDIVISGAIGPLSTFYCRRGGPGHGPVCRGELSAPEMDGAVDLPIPNGMI